MLSNESSTGPNQPSSTIKSNIRFPDNVDKYPVNLPIAKCSGDTRTVFFLSVFVRLYYNQTSVTCQKQFYCIPHYFNVGLFLFLYVRTFQDIVYGFKFMHFSNSCTLSNSCTFQIHALFKNYVLLNLCTFQKYVFFQKFQLFRITCFQIHALFKKYVLSKFMHFPNSCTFQIHALFKFMHFPKLRTFLKITYFF